MSSLSKLLPLWCLSLTSSDAHRQEFQRAIPVRDVQIVQTASTTFASILQVHELVGGSTLVNDPIARQLLRLDAKMAEVLIALDSMNVGDSSYGPLPSSLISYTGDSSIFVDRSSTALVMIDPQGRISRKFAGPTSAPAFRALYSGPVFATPSGALILRVATDPNQTVTLLDAQAGRNVTVARPDSAVLVRYSFETRALDSLARVKQHRGPRISMEISTSGQTLRAQVLPIENVDDWTVLPDGTIALIRGADYHVELLDPVGARRESSKLPYPWQRLTDVAKGRLRDSTNRMWRALQDETIAKIGATRALAIVRDALIATTVTDGGVPTQAPRSSGAPDPPQRASIVVEAIAVNEMPEFYPSISSSTARADRVGNVWILPRASDHSRKGELVYDLVNPSLSLFVRVRLPLGRSVIGFGANGAVYLVSRNSDGRWVLARATVDLPH